MARWTLPTNGDKRIIRYFAFFPVTVPETGVGSASPERRWLEFVAVEQRYRVIGALWAGWLNMRFVDEEGVIPDNVH